MMSRPKRDDVLTRLRKDLRRLYRDRLHGIILYGSRARGDEQPDSDYDVAVFLKAYDGGMREVDRLASVSWEIQKDTGAIVNALPFAAEDMGKDTPLLVGIRRDGISL